MANESLTYLGGWDAINLAQNNTVFVMYIIATVLQFCIWLQLFIHKTKFDLSFLFSLGYLTTDLFLLSAYFVQYAIRIRPWIPITPLFCYFEAYFMFFFNFFELYCLAALNICRYTQVTRNRNIYTTHPRLLIVCAIGVSLFILTNLVAEDLFGWCVVVNKTGSSCDLSYTNIPVRVWNVVVILMIPIVIGFYMLHQALEYLRKTYNRQIVMRRNHHRQLIVGSLIFYSFWATLWLPLMITTFLDIDGTSDEVQFCVTVLNTLETLSDPIICIFLDKRFAQAWKKSLKWITRQFNCNINTRITPGLEMATVR